LTLPYSGTWVETQRVQYKRLEREVDEASGVEAVQPNKRLNQERLEKLKSIGFAWSAKNVRKPKPPTPEGPPKLKKAPADESASRNEARTRLADAQWEELYLRLTQYKEKHFVSHDIFQKCARAVNGLFATSIQALKFLTFFRHILTHANVCYPVTGLSRS
jgi:hypothetical protein